MPVVTIQATRFLGCIFGGAIGDALGMPVTGLTRAEIEQAGGISTFLPAREAASYTIPLTGLAEGEVGDVLLAGQWTDDTQLTLALAETLIHEQGMFIPDAWAHSLVRWLNGGPRTPGLSSVEAAVQLRTGGALWDEAADAEGGGCGAATRVAPAALAFPYSARERRETALLQASTTHGHPDAQAAAIAVCESVAWVLPGSAHASADWDGSAFLQNSIDVLRTLNPAFEEMARCLEIAQSLLLDDVDAGTAVRVLGVSAWSREAVPAALYLVARMGYDFERLMWSAVNLTGGAVESIATIAGAVGGALHGVESIPAEWRRGIEDGPRLVEAALGLYRLSERQATAWQAPFATLS